MPTKDNVLQFEQDVSFWRKRAAECLREKDRAGMLRYLRKGRDAGSPECAAELAKQYSISQSFTSSDRELYHLFRRCGEQDIPETAFYVAACNALALGRWGTARAALDHYLAIAPDGEWAENADALQFNYEDRFYPPEGSRLSRQYALRDKAYEALCTGDLPRAQDAAGRMLPGPERKIYDGAAALMRDEPEEALSLLNEAVTEIKDNFWALALCALAHARCHKSADALSLLSRALPLCSHMGQARLYCDVCIEMHLYSFALDFCNEWTRQFPDSVDCLLMKLRLYKAMGLKDKWVSTREEVLRLDPDAVEEERGTIFTREQESLRTYILRAAHNDLKIGREEDSGSTDE